MVEVKRIFAGSLVALPGARAQRLEGEKIASIVDSRQVEAQLKEPAFHRMIVVFEQNALMPLRGADKRGLEKSHHIVVECGQVNVVARRVNVTNFDLRRSVPVRRSQNRLRSSPTASRQR